jgi:hypothetical protein
MSARRFVVNGSMDASIVAAGALVASMCGVIVLAFAMLAPVAAWADACPNAAERFGASANLPDCRAYELVTPQIKADNSLLVEIDGTPDGEHVLMTSILPFPGAEGGEPQSDISIRTPSGWATTALSSPQGPGELDNLKSEDTGNMPSHASFTSDFSAAFVDSPFASDPLDQNIAYNVYRVAIPSGKSSLASLPDSGPMTEGDYHPPGVETGELSGAFIAGNSADGSHVLFTTLGRIPTAPGTPADTHESGNEVYERYGGHTYLVGILPDGSVSQCGAEVGNGADTGNDYESRSKYGAVAADGSNVVFRSNAEGFPRTANCPLSYEVSTLGALYLRENNGTPAAETVELPGRLFLGRTTDQSKIITEGTGGSAGGTAEGEPIYEFDIPSGHATLLGYGSLVAFSDDGSRVYYFTHTEELKVYDRGVTKTVLGAEKGFATGIVVGKIYSGEADFGETTPDGSKLLFLDRHNLTSYDSSSPICEKIYQHIQGAINAEKGELNHCGEAYIYDLDTGSFTCVSCNPSGLPPIASARLFSSPGHNPWVPFTGHLMSDEGPRVFFETREALVPQDTNGLSDVYEWEGGHVYLLSSGQGGTPGQEVENLKENAGLFGVVGSLIVGASSDGNDVFIATDDRLLPQDIENSLQVYDVRVDGGFPYSTPVYGCDSGQCQGPQTPAPLFAPPPSATFVGLGNIVPEGPKPTVKSKQVKPKPKPKHKHKVKHRKGAQGRGAAGDHKRKGRK